VRALGAACTGLSVTPDTGASAPAQLHRRAQILRRRDAQHPEQLSSLAAQHVDRPVLRARLGKLELERLRRPGESRDAHALGRTRAPAQRRPLEAGELRHDEGILGIAPELARDAGGLGVVAEAVMERGEGIRERGAQIGAQAEQRGVLALGAPQDLAHAVARG